MGEEIRGGHQKLSFIWTHVESELRRRMCDGRGAHINGSNLIDHIKRDKHSVQV